MLNSFVNPKLINRRPEKDELFDIIWVNPVHFLMHNFGSCCQNGAGDQNLYCTDSTNAT